MKERQISFYENSRSFIVENVKRIKACYNSRYGIKASVQGSNVETYVKSLGLEQKLHGLNPSTIIKPLFFSFVIE